MMNIKIYSILLAFILLASGCAATRNIHYYAPKAESGIFEDSFDHYTRLSSRDGPPDRIILNNNGIEIQVQIENIRIIPITIGPMCLPILPAFITTPFLPHQTVSDKRPLEVIICFQQTQENTFLYPKKNTVIIDEDLTQHYPFKISGYLDSSPLEETTPPEFIQLKGPQNDQFFVHRISIFYNYSGPEPKKIRLCLNGIFINQKMVSFPDVIFEIASDTLFEIGPL